MFDDAILWASFGICLLDLVLGICDIVGHCLDFRSLYVDVVGFEFHDVRFWFLWERFRWVMGLFVVVSKFAVRHPKKPK